MFLFSLTCYLALLQCHNEPQKISIERDVSKNVTFIEFFLSHSASANGSDNRCGWLRL